MKAIIFVFFFVTGVLQANTITGAFEFSGKRTEPLNIWAMVGEFSGSATYSVEHDASGFVSGQITYGPETKVMLHFNVGVYIEPIVLSDYSGMTYAIDSAQVGKNHAVESLVTHIPMPLGFTTNSQLPTFMFDLERGVGETIWKYVPFVNSDINGHATGFPDPQYLALSVRTVPDVGATWVLMLPILAGIVWLRRQ